MTTNPNPPEVVTQGEGPVEEPHVILWASEQATASVVGSGEDEGEPEIAQADREAAANYHYAEFSNLTIRAAMRRGDWDHREIVQAFAKHRRDARMSDTPASDGLRSALERAESDLHLVTLHGDVVGMHREAMAAKKRVRAALSDAGEGSGVAAAAAVAGSGEKPIKVLGEIAARYEADPDADNAFDRALASAFEAGKRFAAPASDGLREAFYSGFNAGEAYDCRRAPHVDEAWGSYRAALTAAISRKHSKCEKPCSWCVANNIPCDWDRKTAALDQPRSGKEK